MDELTTVYIQESREQLAAMEAGLLRLEQQPDDSDNINGIFRAAHTIKGGAGVVECHFIVSFTHLVENLLDALRNGDIAVSSPLATLLFECCDHMGSLVDVLAAQAPEPEAGLLARGEALTLRLKSILEANKESSSTPGNSSLTVHDNTVEVETSGGGVVMCGFGRPCSRKAGSSGKAAKASRNWRTRSTKASQSAEPTALQSTWPPPAAPRS